MCCPYMQCLPCVAPSLMAHLPFLSCSRLLTTEILEQGHSRGRQDRHQRNLPGTSRTKISRHLDMYWLKMLKLIAGGHPLGDSLDIHLLQEKHGSSRMLGKLFFWLVVDSASPRNTNSWDEQTNSTNHEPLLFDKCFFFYGIMI